MWAYAITAPGRLERVEVPAPSPAEGQRLVRLRAGGICGSDLPLFRGRRSEHFIDNSGDPGFPLHEVVGEAEDGTRVVGWAAGHRGLAEWFVADSGQVIAVDSDLSDVEATVIQPLCTVLHALDRLGDVSGRRAAVIGLGSIGLLFAHVLAARGAQVTGVDRVDRRAFAEPFALHEVLWADAAALPADAYDLVIEAVGHQTHTLSAAVEALAFGGTLLAFGVPDDSHYPFPFTRFFRKNGTLLAGITVERAQEASELAVAPMLGRTKIVLSVADVDSEPARQ